MRDEIKIIHRRNMKPYSSGSVVNSVSGAFLPFD
ncbi:hypothetical protein ABIF68_010158 [Bradyrhizobium japonicum]